MDGGLPHSTITGNYKTLEIPFIFPVRRHQNHHDDAAQKKPAGEGVPNSGEPPFDGLNEGVGGRTLPFRPAFTRAAACPNERTRPSGRSRPTAPVLRRSSRLPESPWA